MTMEMMSAGDAFAVFLYSVVVIVLLHAEDNTKQTIFFKENPLEFFTPNEPGAFYSKEDGLQELSQRPPPQPGERAARCKDRASPAL
jgi:hypothetical protein